MRHRRSLYRLRAVARSRAAAGLVMCLFVAVAMVLHRDAGPAALTVDPHAGHIMPELVPAAVATPLPLPRSAWTVTADSEDGTSVAENTIDGDSSTIWRSGETAFPPTLTIDTHNMVAVSGLTYQPPDDTPNGRIGQYVVSISTNGTSWGQPAASGPC